MHEELPRSSTEGSAVWTENGSPVVTALQSPDQHGAELRVFGLTAADERNRMERSPDGDRSTRPRSGQCSAQEGANTFANLATPHS